MLTSLFQCQNEACSNKEALNKSPKIGIKCLILPPPRHSRNSGSFSDSPNRFMFKVDLFFRQPFPYPCHPFPPRHVISYYTNGANHQDSRSNCLQDVSYLLSLPLRLLPALITPPSHHYQRYLSVRTPVDRNRFPG